MAHQLAITGINRKVNHLCNLQMRIYKNYRKILAQFKQNH